MIFSCLKESFITAFFTRSSAANIPVNMALCKKLGLDRDTYSISIPLGAAINMAGAAITISTMALAAAHTLGIQVSAGSALIMCVVAAISAAGSSGVAGGSLLLIPLACSLFGIPIFWQASPPMEPSDFRPKMMRSSPGICAPRLWRN